MRFLVVFNAREPVRFLAMKPVVRGILGLQNAEMNVSAGESTLGRDELLDLVPVEMPYRPDHARQDALDVVLRGGGNDADEAGHD
ncbi:MAG: hypothetical protein ACLPT4_12990 [Verrucomicrobiia bacterium]